MEALVCEVCRAAIQVDQRRIVQELRKSAASASVVLECSNCGRFQICVGLVVPPAVEIEAADPHARHFCGHCY